jgi:hypothetical protein
MSPDFRRRHTRALSRFRVFLTVVATAFCWSCAGEATTTHTSAIIRGEPVADALPSLAAIILRERNADEDLLAVICSGTLIAPRVVLTAAHCIEHHGPENSPAGVARTWFVSFAADLTGLGRDNFALPADAIPVISTRIHPAFSIAENTRVGLGPSHDLGLVFLSEPVSDRSPSLLATIEAAAGLQPGATVIVAGYGSRSPEGAAAPEGEPGLKSFGIAEVLEVGSHELRVGRPHHPKSPREEALADKCSGDSGGPTFLALGEIFFLIGLSSRGYDSDQRCDSAALDLRVDVFVPWIREQLVAEQVGEEAGEEVGEATPPAAACSAGGKLGASPASPGAALLMILAVLGTRQLLRRCDSAITAT